MMPGLSPDLPTASVRVSPLFTPTPLSACPPAFSSRLTARLIRLHAKSQPAHLYVPLPPTPTPVPPHVAA